MPLAALSNALRSEHRESHSSAKQSDGVLAQLKIITESLTPSAVRKALEEPVGSAGTMQPQIIAKSVEQRHGGVINLNRLRLTVDFQ